MNNTVRAIICAVAAIVIVACDSTGPGGGREKVASTSISGSMTNGAPCIGSTVNIYRPVDGAKGPALASVLTDEDGSWSVALDYIEGDALVCGTGGGHEDPYTSMSLKLGASEYCTYVPNVANASNISLHFLGHQAWCLTQHRIASGVDAPSAWISARADVSRFWACAFPHLDVVEAVPTDLLSHENTGVGPESMAALASAMASTQASLLSSEMGYQPGTRLTSIGVNEAYCEDLIADGSYDATGRFGPIWIDGFALKAESFGDPYYGLGQSCRTYLNSPRNRTGLTEATLGDEIACLGVDGGPLLPGAGLPGADDVGPSVVPVSPPAGAIVSGTAEVIFDVIDNVEAHHATFVAPETVVDVVTHHATDSTGATDRARLRIRGLIDTDTHSEGLLRVAVKGSDRAGNTNIGEMELLVHNSVGDIDMILSPERQPTAGVVSVGCLCADGPELVGCVLTWPPPDLVEPIVGSELFSFDSELVADGDYTLTCEARTEGLATGAGHLAISIGNVPAVRYCGHVAAEGDLSVEVIALEHHATSNDDDIVLASAPVSDGGTWCLDVDTPAKEILIRTNGRDGRYRSPVTPGSFALGRRRLQAWVHHDPHHPETREIWLHAPSTIGVDLCVGYAATQSYGLHQACESTHDFLGDLLFDVRADVRFVGPAPLSSGAAFASEEEQVVLIFTIGLDYYGALLSHLTGETPSDLTWLRLLTFIQQDAGDGILDGQLLDAAVEIANEPLSGRAISSGVALGALMYLREVPIGAHAVTNVTGLDASSFEDWIQRVATLVSGWMEPSEGAELDIDVAVVTPPALQSRQIRGRAEVCVDVLEESEVTHYALITDRDDLAFDDVALTPTESGYRLCGALDTTDGDDGELIATAIIVDQNGGRAEVPFSLTVTNAPPSVLIPENAGTTISGVVEELIFCAEGQNIEDVTVEEPSGLDATFTLVTSTRGCVTVNNYDTTVHSVDRTVTFRVAALGNGGIRGVAEISYVLDNFATGLVRGCAFVDSPLVGSSVTACKRTSATTCEPFPSLAATTDADGCFELRNVPDSYAGLIELRVTGGEYIDSWQGHRIEQGTFGGYTHTLWYEPKPSPGALHQHRSIQIWTRAADEWARSNSAKYVSLRESYTSSYVQHAEHLGLDIAQVYPRDLVPESATRHANLRDASSNDLGASMMGFSAQASRIAVDNGQPAGAVNSLMLHAAILDSAASGLHDGLDDAGQLVRILESSFDANSLLRKGHADSVGLWIQSERNHSEIRLWNVGGAAGLLVRVSENRNEELFGSLIPVAYDSAAPILEVRLVDGASAPTQTSPLRVDTPVWLWMQATDVGGFRDGLGDLILPTVVFSGTGQAGAPLGAYELLDEGEGSVTVRWPLRHAELDDGEYAAQVAIRNPVGNTSQPEQLDFSVDWTKPVFDLDVLYRNPDKMLVASQTVAARWSATDEEGSGIAVVRFETSANGGATVTQAAPAIVPSTTSGDVEMNLGACNGQFLTRAAGEDRAGNRAESAWENVRCDAVSPTAWLLESSYHNAHASREIFKLETQDYDRSERILGDVRGTWPDVTDLFIWHDEYYDGSGRVPTLLVAVDDSGVVSSSNEDLRIWWEYEGVGEYELSPQNARANGEYELRLEPRFLHRPTNTASPDLVHTIRFYVEDEAGHITDLTYSWRFVWKFGRVYVYGCDESAALSQLSLDDTSAEGFYDERDNDLVSGTVYWAYGGGAEPPNDTSLVLEVGDGQVHTRVTSLSDDKVVGSTFTNMARLCSDWPSHRFDGDDPCLPGALEDETVNSTHAKPQSSHGISYTVGGSTSATGRLELPHDSNLELTLQGVAMELMNGGSRVFSASNRYADSRYALASRTGLDEVNPHMEQICDGEIGCVSFPVADRQQWEKRAYVTGLRVDVGELGIGASVQIASDYVQTLEVQRLDGCAAGFAHTTNR